MRTTALLGLLVAAIAACDSEEREFRSAPPAASPWGMVRIGELEPGEPGVDTAWTVYEENRWAVADGARLYVWFNCAGCHAAAGGGGIGPPLRDSLWIYGSDPENVFATIVQGRPEGMPSYRGRLASAEVWKLVSFVRSLARLTPPDTWAARTDDMADAAPRRRDPGRPPP